MNRPRDPLAIPTQAQHARQQKAVRLLMLLCWLIGVPLVFVILFFALQYR
jgi:hypothetical protein